MRRALKVIIRNHGDFMDVTLLYIYICVTLMAVAEILSRVITSMRSEHEYKPVFIVKFWIIFDAITV